MHTTVKFAKVRPTAKIPTKRDEDAGYDIYANFEEDYYINNAYIEKAVRASSSYPRSVCTLWIFRT